VNAIVEMLAALGIFAAGLIARLGVVVAIMAALLVPVLAYAGGRKLLRAMSLWGKGYRNAGGLKYRNGLLYAPGHTWVKVEPDRLQVGIDDLAQRILPWTVGVKFAAVGQKVAQGETVARISCGDRDACVAAPVSGRVVQVNAAVLAEPTLVKSESYGRGWLVAIEPEGRGYKQLVGGEAARAWMAAEGERLTRFFEDQLGFAAADGGELIAPPPALLAEPQWKALVKAFLRT
jgi:glycine cleavage system H lipoate-binding protein